MFHVVAQRTAIGPFFAAFDIAPSPSQVTSPNGDGHSLVATSTHPYIYTTPCGDTVPTAVHTGTHNPHVTAEYVQEPQPQRVVALVSPRDTAVIRREGEKIRSKVPYRTATLQQ